MTLAKKIRILIVDDSASVRQMLMQTLQSDSEIKVVGVAQDPYIAVEKIPQNPPDVITPDIEMPRMDGLTFLEKIMSQNPILTVICSTLTESSSDVAIRALEKGAVTSSPNLSWGLKNFLKSLVSRFAT